MKIVTNLDKVKQNPFAHEYKDGTAAIGFWVPYLVEPLWWTGNGFKNLVKLACHPKDFSSKVEAELLIKNEILTFIHQYRTDQTALIKGWEDHGSQAI